MIWRVIKILLILLIVTSCRSQMKLKRLDAISLQQGVTTRVMLADLGWEDTLWVLPAVASESIITTVPVVTKVRKGHLVLKADTKDTIRNEQRDSIIYADYKVNDKISDDNGHRWKIIPNCFRLLVVLFIIEVILRLIVKRSL